MTAAPLASAAAPPALVLPRLTLAQMRDRVEDLLWRATAERDGAVVSRPILLERSDELELVVVMLFLESLIPMQQQVAELRRTGGRRS